MTYCSRCLLCYATRAMNLVMNFCGIAMIIYSLWLIKAWKQGVEQLHVSSPPSPRYIYIVLGIGIVICFTALVGHAIFNSLNSAALSFYILFICLILFFQTVVIVQVLIKIDWPRVIAKHFGRYIKFVDIFSFHANICRLVGIVLLLAQVNVLLLAIILRAMGPQPRNHCERYTIPQLLYSFLEVGGSKTLPGLPASNPPSPGDSNFEPALLILPHA